MGGNVKSIPLDCCRMVGVYCTPNGHVTELYWGNQSLSKFIPPEIGNLVNLKGL
jgi:hypothetical protein